MNQGYLRLKESPRPGQRFKPSLVDWSKTVAWGEGGYYAGCFLNVQGREPQGVIPPGEYETVRAEIKEKLEALTDHQGRPMGTKAYRPEDLYMRLERVPPDLVVLFGDLRWRSVGTLGHKSVYSFDHELGSDDANHAQDGIYLVTHRSLEPRGRLDGPTLYDVAPTILRQLGLPIPEDMRGRPIA
jgi:predicted AlkP superfamily phosphohydrolase/phosphomutase